MNDLIRRQDAFEELKKEYNRKGAESGWEPGFGLKLAWIEKAINSVPEAKPDVPDINVGDMISRQAAIDRINKQREHLQPDIYPQDQIGDAAYRICAEFIGRLPSAQQWIPCSDDLPDKEVLCCDIRGGIMIGYIAISNESETNYIAESEHEYMYDCIAWMPLPDPWKGDPS